MSATRICCPICGIPAAFCKCGALDRLREDCPWKCKADDKRCLCAPRHPAPYTEGAPDPARLSGEAMP